MARRPNALVYTHNVMPRSPMDDMKRRLKTPTSTSTNQSLLYCECAGSLIYDEALFDWWVIVQKASHHPFTEENITDDSSFPEYLSGDYFLSVMNEKVTEIVLKGFLD